MNQTLKSVIAGAIGLAVLAVGYAAVSYVNSYGKSIQPSSFRSFSVTGDGKSVSIPDVAEFSFTVITEGGKDLTALQKQNTDSANKVIAFVKSNGVADKDVKTNYYNVNPRYENYSCYDAPAPMRDTATSSAGSVGAGMGSSAVYATPPSAPAATPMTKVCPPPSIVGYTVTQSVEVKVRDFNKVGDIMGGVVTNGANQVGSLAFTLDDPTSAQDTARAQAITKAKTKAEGVAKAGGFAIGRLLSIQEGGAYPYSAYKSSDVSYSMGAGEAVPAPAIQPGSQETNVTVTMTYEIK